MSAADAPTSPAEAPRTIPRPDPVPLCSYLDGADDFLEGCGRPAVGVGCNGPTCAVHLCGPRCGARRLYAPAAEAPAITEEPPHLPECECPGCQAMRLRSAAPEVGEAQAIADEPAAVYAAEAVARVLVETDGVEAVDADELEGELARAYRAGQHRGQEDMRADRTKLCDEAYEAGRADGQREERERTVRLLGGALLRARGRRRTTRALERLLKAFQPPLGDHKATAKGGH